MWTCVHMCMDVDMCNVMHICVEINHISPRFGELTSAELLLEMGDCEFSGEASLVRTGALS